MDERQSSDWQLYPNPVRTNIITLKSPSHLKLGAYFTINDLSGKMLKRGDLPSVTNPTFFLIDVADLVPNTYIFHINSGKQRWNFTIVVAD